MKRSGIKRKAWPKRRGKPRAKSKKRPPRENLDVRQVYRDANPECELWGLLKDSLDCDESRQLWFPEWMQWTRPEANRTVQIHHIFGGNARRYDVESNLIALSDPAHRWCHKHPILGRVACLWTKQAKGELNSEVMRGVAGMYLAGWVAQDKVREECERFGFWSELRVELLESIEGE